MRLSSITVACLLASSSAFASSVEAISTSILPKSDSVVTEACTHCPAPQAMERKKDYVVPMLKPGTQTTEIREINGEKKMVRTEAWLGGSPVVFISKAPDAAQGLAETGATPDGVDLSATTSAVVSGAAVPVSASLSGAMPATPQPLDVGSFTLRP